MRRLWLFWFPLLFAPNLTFARTTSYGTLTLIDLLIWPYLVLLFLSLYGTRNSWEPSVNSLVAPTLVFSWWAFIGTLSIPLRYPYDTNFELYFGLLKLGKFVLFVVAGLLTVRALAVADCRTQFKWSLLAAGAVISISLLIVRPDSPLLLRPVASRLQGDYLDNLIGSVMAVLLPCLVGMVLAGYVHGTARRCIAAGAFVLALAMFLTAGRGGWVAALVATAYLLVRLRSWRGLVLLFAAGGTLLLAFYSFPTFQYELGRTLSPGQEYLEEYDAGFLGLDDGGRLAILADQAPRFHQAPILGRGFFHRGPLSGIAFVGSHNFFVQIFLETGIVGGAAVVLFCRRMWQHAGTLEAKQIGSELPVKAALVGAFVAGLSGEYFYGGVALLSVLAVYGLAGSLPGRCPTRSPTYGVVKRYAQERRGIERR